MSDSKKQETSEADAALEREIRRGRKFTLEEAIGRLAGPGAMKGESPVSRLKQVENEIALWLRAHVADSSGALELVLNRYVSGSELMLNNFEQPLVVLAACCRRVLDSENLLQELVRAADTEWGRIMGERPYFEKSGSPAHSADPYTIESVRTTLGEILKQLAKSEL